MKTTIQLMLIFLLLSFVPLETSGEQINHREDYFDRLQMKAEIKSLLRGSMSNYFDPASFMLDLQMAFIDVIPNKYHLPEMDEDIVIAELPGVPFIRIPRFSATETDLYIAEETKPDFIHVFERIHLNIYADNFYGSDDLNFMRMLAAMILEINTDAGDEINIFQIAMPRLTLLERRIEQPEQPEYPLPVEMALEPVRFNEPQATPGKSTAVLPLSRIVWLGALIFMAILMVILLAFYLIKKRRLPMEENLLPNSNNEKTQAASRRHSGVSPDETLIKKISNTNGDRNAQKDHLFVTTCFLEHTNEIALLFDNWINRNELEGTNRIARIINMLDPRYLRLFEGLVSEYASSSIEEAMQDPDNKCIEIDNKQISQLAVDLKRFLYSGNSKGISAFHFLNYMDNDTLLDLCHKLEPIELSILMDNLPDEKVSKVFNGIGPDTTASVMKINVRKMHINFLQVNDLAEKCFTFFREQKAGKEYNVMNLGRMVGLLEELSIEKQERFLNSIRRNDPDLHETINSRLLTWRKLTEMEPHVLRTALARTDSRALAFSFSDAESATKEKILSLRSKREQLLIRDLMSEATSTPAETKEKAKQTVLETVRKHLQANLQHLTSNIQHPTSNIQNPTSNI